MQYLKSYQYLFDSPRWLLNLLLTMLCFLVPVAGDMVRLGYHYEIIQAMHLKGEDDYPDFDFNRLGAYFLRGLWVWLVQVIVMLPLAVVGAVFGFACSIVVVAVTAGGKTEPSPWVLVVIALLDIVVMGGGGLLVALVSVPMSLRAGLSQDLGAAFSWPFIRDFIGRVWLEIILVHLFLALTGTVIVLAGFLVFCLGMYPAVALVSFAHAHLVHQLYELYLQRGGTAIALQVER